MRIAETIQIDPEFLVNLVELGIVPGATVKAEHTGGRVFISANSSDEGIALDHDLAVHIFVSA
jgi:Fe2+ transport system protein FeoA